MKGSHITHPSSPQHEAILFLQFKQTEEPCNSIKPLSLKQTGHLAIQSPAIPAPHTITKIVLFEPNRRRVSFIHHQ